MKLPLLLIFLTLLLSQQAFCQSADSSKESLATALSNYNNLSTKSLSAVNDQYAKLTGAVNAKSQKLLAGMQKREARLQAKMMSLDSTKAKQLFTGTQAKYQLLSAKLQSLSNPSILHPLQEYIPGLDSMQTAMQFLQNANSKLPGILSSSKLQQIQSLGTQVQALESKLQSANTIQSYVQEREATLQSALSKYSVNSQLLGMNKQVFYYQQQLATYKAMLSDKKLMQQKAFSLVQQLPAYKNFMSKYSYFAQLFGAPGEPVSAAALPGLQTQAQVGSLISQHLNSMSGDVNPSAFLAQKVQGAQDALSILKSKVSSYTNGNSNMTMPDFTPNEQKTKTFLQHLEFGFNFQSEQGTGILPATTDIGLSVGYMLSDKATIGTGMSYKLGLGTGLSHIQLSNQGLGLRSYMDIKAKGSIWVTGGFEYNYYSAFAGVHDVEDLNSILWQKSALIGLTKKYKVGSKNCNMQLLYDLLSRYEVPTGQAFKFRLGYSF